jgi:hypothetical protein
MWISGRIEVERPKRGAYDIISGAYICGGWTLSREQTVNSFSRICYENVSPKCPQRKTDHMFRLVGTDDVE